MKCQCQRNQQNDAGCQFSNRVHRVIDWLSEITGRRARSCSGFPSKWPLGTQQIALEGFNKQHKRKRHASGQERIMPLRFKCCTCFLWLLSVRGSGDLESDPLPLPVLSQIFSECPGCGLTAGIPHGFRLVWHVVQRASGRSALRDTHPSRVEPH